MNRNEILICLLLLACMSCSASEEVPAEPDRIPTLTAALQQGGISELMEISKRIDCKAPRIPSKWSVETRSTTADERASGLAARQFGRELAIQLKEVALSMREMPPGDALNQRAHLLCDLSEWCASADGYGNLLLAQRSLDLATVGLARLIASLDFSLEECGRLADRMTPSWMAAEARVRTLNREADANLFTGITQEEISLAWASGRHWMREKRSGDYLPEGTRVRPDILKTRAILANLDFFEDDDGPRIKPLTLLNSWNAKRFERIVNGLELRNVREARALLKFRTIVGRFPEEPEFTEEELRGHEEAVIKWAERGIKISRMDEGRPVGVAAFDLAWSRHPEERKKDHTLYAPAWRAFERVITGQFVDEDARNEGFVAKKRTLLEQGGR